MAFDQHVSGQTDFIDFYELMQISPNAEYETIQRVFRMLATKYHPDNPETADSEKFLALNQAYQILSNPELRASYDEQYRLSHTQPLKIFELREFALGIDGEANRRLGLLCLLYNKRRSDPDKAGMSILQLETLMACPREHLLFTIWYLKEMGQVRQEESSDFVITGPGVDYVEANLSSHQALYRLLKAAESGTARSAGREKMMEAENRG